MVKNALEPSWEARFEGCSYGFRPGRGCHDAIEKIYRLARPNSRRKWVLDADIKGAFDHISHEHLLTTIGRVPGIELIKQWRNRRVRGERSLSRNPGRNASGWSD
jgi:RNA-directed DNA polymerase